MNRFSVLAVALLLSIPLQAATLSVRPAGKGRVDVVAEGASLFALGEALEMQLKTSVTVDLEEDRTVDFLADSITPLAALRRVAEDQRLEVVPNENGYLLRDPAEPRLSIDVKDAPVAEILQSIKEQCGIRNMMVDPDVKGSGTFLFTDVPCRTAIRVVFQTLGLQGETYANSVVRVIR